MQGNGRSNLKLVTFTLAVFASTSFLFQGCHSHSQIKTGDAARPELYGKEILRHADEKDRFESQLLVYLEEEARAWRDIAMHLSAALDTLNAYVRLDTIPMPPDFRPRDCPGPDCAGTLPPPGCKLRPDCN